MTGQEITSDFIIAERLAVLKSDHMPDAPVRSTSTPPELESARAGPSAASAALHHRRWRSARRPPDDRGVAVARDRHARRGGTTRRTAGSRRSVRSTLRDHAAGRPDGHRPRRRVDDDHQAVAAERPWKLRSISCRGLHRLGAGRLPAGSRQGGLDARGEEAERDRDDDPAASDDAEVRRGVAAETADRADFAACGYSSATDSPADRAAARRRSSRAPPSPARLRGGRAPRRADPRRPRPAWAAIGSPSRSTISVGIERIPNRPASAGSASTSTLAKRYCGRSSAASRTGAPSPAGPAPPRPEVDDGQPRLPA